MNLKNISRFIFCITIFCSSCTEYHYYYVPDIQNVPLFTNKKQIKAEVTFGGAKNLTLANFNTAYSISNHLMVLGQFCKIGYKASSQYSLANSTKYNYFNGALGYYRLFNKKGNLQLIGGIGNGSEKHTYVSDILANTYLDDGTAKVHYTKLYLQPAIGYIIKNFECSFSTQLSNLNYYNISNNVYPYNIGYNEINYLSNNNNNFFIEPCINFSVGFNSFKFQFQFLRSYNLSHSSIPQIQTPLIIGFQYKFKNRDNY